jgi:hypothetical protein
MSDFLKNPLLPNDVYVCDVEARTFGDRLYLYGSCAKESGKAVFRVYSTDDMLNFTDHGVAFSSDDVNWIDVNELWAPDCAYFNGRYYLYYSLPTREMGVAVSDCPYGPFADIGRVDGVSGIDPAVLVDDDGNPYLFWGQGDGVRAARLKPTMTEIEEDTVTQPLTISEHGMHEGSSIRKKDGRYYYVYTETGRRDKPTCQGHSISDSPTSGYKYCGVVVDVFGCDPKSWNNHGCIECFKGQWYIFYHRATSAVHSWSQPRQLCVEKIFFDSDGKIAEVLPTSSGVGDAIPATEVIPACCVCHITGGAYNDHNTESNHYLSLDNINPWTTATYRYIEFNGEDTVLLRLKGEGECRIELFIDGKYHAFALIDLAMFFENVEFKMPCVEGRHTVSLHFYGMFADATLDEIKFSKKN